VTLIQWPSEFETLVPFQFHQRRETIYIANISLEKPMVTITYSATEHIAYTLSEQQVGDDVVLRIKVTKDDVEMQPDEIRPGDETFDHNGKVVLVLDQQTSQLLAIRPSI